MYQTRKALANIEIYRYLNNFIAVNGSFGKILISQKESGPEERKPRTESSIKKKYNKRNEQSKLEQKRKYRINQCKLQPSQN